MTKVNALWPRAKSCPQPVFVNKVLLKHNYTQLFRYCLWLPLPYDGMGICSREHMVPKDQNIYIFSLYRKFCQPLV